MSSSTSYASALKDFQAGRYLQSLEALNALLDTQQDARIYTLLAKTLLQLGFKANAATAYELASGYEGINKREYVAEAVKLHYECGHEDQALAILLRELALVSGNVDVIAILFAIQEKRGQPDTLTPYLRVLAASNNPKHHLIVTDFIIKKWSIVSEATRREAVEILFKRYPQALSLRHLHLMHARALSDFKEIAKHHAMVESAIAKGNLDIVQADLSHHNLFWCGDEDINRRALGNSDGRGDFANARSTRRSMSLAPSGKIRLSYVSSDFWDRHATMTLLRAVLERHDPSRFDVTLFCHTNREHLQRNKSDRSKWGTIHSIDGLSDDAAASQIRAAEVDIVVDLKGLTNGNRVFLFNRPLAPLHVSWLGFPGSTVVADLDYIVGDHFVLPESSRPFYKEKFCRLPETYQPNDPFGRPLPGRVTRARYGLPEDGFVFVSFNANKKITQDMLDLWFRILRRTKDSILWLLVTQEEPKKNILTYAKRQGMSPSRIVFTPMVDYAGHINRIPLADLGLDTYPCNGHTTTSEQLWAGLPLLTVKGTNFASRVSESLLNAIGLPELVAPDLQAYEDMAVALYEDRETLGGYRQRLIDNRFTHPLFDAERFTRHLEAAYEMMVERARAGLEPDHFDVPALPARTEAFHSLPIQEAAE